LLLADGNAPVRVDRLDVRDVAGVVVRGGLGVDRDVTDLRGRQRRAGPVDRVALKLPVLKPRPAVPVIPELSRMRRQPAALTCRIASTKTDLGRRVLCLGRCVLATGGRRKLLDESLAGK
jgi:hypothetical protein